MGVDIEEMNVLFVFQICVQCIVGLLLGCVGVAQMTGEFKEIRAAAEMANK